jgi:hypothetical protein
MKIQEKTHKNERIFSLPKDNFKINLWFYSIKSQFNIIMWYLSVFFHWDDNYCTYHTFFSHVKACIDVDIKTFDKRFGSDDEGGLTKALDSVFPNSSRLLCTKHIKDNGINHSKNKLPMTKDECNDAIEDIFGFEFGKTLSRAFVSPPSSSLPNRLSKVFISTSMRALTCEKNVWYVQ